MDTGADTHVVYEPVVVTRIPDDDESMCVHTLLEQEGIIVSACESMQHVIDQIEKGAGPIILSSEALSDVDSGSLFSYLSTQPYWSDVPVMVLESSPGQNGGVMRLLNQRNVTILKQPVEAETILGLVRAAIESRRRQVQLRDLLQHLEELHHRATSRARHLQRLTMRLARAEHDERARIASVIHDEFQQLLVAARMRLGSMLSKDDGGAIPAPAVTEGCQDVDELLEDALRAARNLTRELAPPILRHGGLIAAIRWLAQTSEERHNLTVTVKVDPESDELSRHMQVFLFEAARELLFNVAKHAGVPAASVELTARDGSIFLSVKDDGQGFDPATLEDESERTGGFGLLSIGERASLLGGDLQVHAHPGTGCAVSICLPTTAHGEEGEHPSGADAELERILPSPVEYFRNGDAPKRVLIVDDHKIVRQGIATMLARQSDIIVVGEAADGEEAVEKARALQPDVILMDVSMPGMNGIEATRAIHAEMNSVVVIGLSMFEMEEIGQQMLAAGAKSYLSKSGPARQLVEEIRTS